MMPPFVVSRQYHSRHSSTERILSQRRINPFRLFGNWCNVNTRQADKAISSIKPGHIQEVKKLPNPADVIKMVFDCILLLFHLPVRVVKFHRSRYL